jgi:cell division septal protein FtsQ
MNNGRLTPFENLGSDQDPFNPQVQSVDNLIAKRKAYNRLVRRNRWLKRAAVFLLTGVLAFLSYAYVVTPMSTVNRIEISGNHLLSKQALLETLQVNLNSPLWQLDLVVLNQALHSIDLVETGRVSLQDHNTIKIQLTEKRGVALVLSAQGLIMLTQDAQFISMTPDHLLMNMNLPLIINMEETEDLTALALILGTLNDEILVNISEIHKERMAYNEPQLRLMMQEGNTVFAPLSALSALDKYLQVVKMTNEKNSCFTIADISFSLVKQACPTY